MFVHTTNHDRYTRPNSYQKRIAYLYHRKTPPDNIKPPFSLFPIVCKIIDMPPSRLHSARATFPTSAHARFVKQFRHLLNLLARLKSTALSIPNSLLNDSTSKLKRSPIPPFPRMTKRTLRHFPEVSMLPLGARQQIVMSVSRVPSTIRIPIAPAIWRKFQATPTYPNRSCFRS